MTMGTSRMAINVPFIARTRHRPPTNNGEHGEQPKRAAEQIWCGGKHRRVKGAERSVTLARYDSAVNHSGVRVWC